MITDIPGVCQLGSTREFSENKRKSNQAIREQVGQQKTRDRVGGSNRASGEQLIGVKEQSRSERCGASNWVGRERERGYTIMDCILQLPNGFISLFSLLFSVANLFSFVASSLLLVITSPDDSSDITPPPLFCFGMILVSLDG